MESVLNNRERAIRAINAFWIMLGISAVYSLLNYYHLQEIKDLGEYEAQFTDTANIIAILSIIFFIVYITSIVLFIQWFRRAYCNLQRAGYDTEFREGWAAASWFVPLLNLFRPYQIMKEIWDKTQIPIPDFISTKKNSALVGWWWTAFIIGNVVDNASLRIIEEYQASVSLEIISSLLDVLGLLLVITIIRNISNFEEAFYHSKHEKDISDHLIE